MKRLISTYFRGQEDVVKNLLNNGTDCNKKTKSGKTPLFFAVIGSQASIVKLLINSGADVFFQDNLKITPIKLAQMKILIFKKQEESDEAEVLKSEVLEVCKIIKDHVLKMENGKKLILDNCFTGHLRLTKLPTNERRVILQNLQTKLRNSYKHIHYYL